MQTLRCLFKNIGICSQQNDNNTNNTNNNNNNK